MSVFAGLSQYQAASERGTFFTPGSYRLCLERCLVKQTQNSGVGFIAESSIIASRPTFQIDPRTGAPYIPLPVGHNGTWFQSLNSKAIAFPSIKAFAYAFLGLKISKPEHAAKIALVDSHIEVLMDKVTGVQNIFAGLVADCDCENIKTKEGKDFTRHTFSAIDDVQIDIEALLNFSAPAFNAPPLPPLPTASVGFILPPGAQMSPDKKWYLPAGGQAWLPTP